MNVSPFRHLFHPDSQVIGRIGQKSWPWCTRCAMSRSVGKCWVLFLCIWEMIRRKGGDWLSHCILKSRLFPIPKKALVEKPKDTIHVKHTTIVDYGSTGLSVARWKKITSAFKQLVDNLHLHSLDAFAPGECGGYSMTTTPWLWSLFSKKRDTGYYTFLFAIERVLLCIDVLGCFGSLHTSLQKPFGLLPAESSTECWQRRSSKRQRRGWTAAPCARTGKPLQKGLPWSSKLHFLPMGRKLDPSSWRLVEFFGGQEMDTQLGQTVWRMVLYSVLGLGVKMWFFEREFEAQILPYSLLI